MHCDVFYAAQLVVSGNRAFLVQFGINPNVRFSIYTLHASDYLTKFMFMIIILLLTWLFYTKFFYVML